MMETQKTVDGIISELDRFGVTLDTDGTTVFLYAPSGTKPELPEDLIETIRRNKPAIIQWLSHPCRPGWGAIPPEDLALRKRPPYLSPADRKRLISFAFGQMQIPEIEAWLDVRMAAYYRREGRHWDCAVIMLASAADLLCWQFRRPLNEALQVLQHLVTASQHQP